MLQGLGADRAPITQLSAAAWPLLAWVVSDHVFPPKNPSGIEFGSAQLCLAGFGS